MQKTIKLHIVFFIISLYTSAYSQVKCYQYYHKQVKTNIAKNDYLKALDNIEFANACPDKPDNNNLKKLNKICRDSIAELINRIKKEQNNTQKALLEAERMRIEAEQSLEKNKYLQKQIETAIFDKAVKEFFPHWKGFANMSEANGTLNDEGKSIINRIYKLDLSNNALSKLPKEVTKCKNLEFIDLRGNNNLDWQKVREDIKGLKEGLELAVSIKNIDGIPKQLQKHITNIELVDDSLTKIPTLLLEQKQLHSLTINAHIDSIPEQLNKLTNLSSFNCSENQLESLPSSICGLVGLKSLYLNSNKITTISNDISHLKNLNTLCLDNNNLSELPKKLFRLNKLNQISLSKNQISQIPDEIKNLKNLTKLNLSNNKLKELPGKIWNLHYLSELKVSNNNLQSLPPEILNLHYLKYLDAKNNELKTIPKAIWTLRNLAYIDVSNNKIKDLPIELWGLYSLEYFNLSNNQLTDIPKTLGKLKKVEKVNLSNNKLTKIPKALLTLQSLEYLNLNDNEIANIPKDVRNLKNLKELYLTGNKITKIPSGIAEMDNLCVLFIGNLSLNVKKFTSFLKSCTKTVQLTDDANRCENSDSKYLRIYVTKIFPEWNKYKLE